MSVCGAVLQFLSGAFGRLLVLTFVASGFAMMFAPETAKRLLKNAAVSLGLLFLVGFYSIFSASGGSCATREHWAGFRAEQYERALELRLRRTNSHLSHLKAQVCEADAEKVEAALCLLNLDSFFIGPHNVSECEACFREIYPEFAECDEEDTQRIELACRPVDPRPGDLIADVIEGTGLPLRDPASKFFGCWAWEYADVPKGVWQEAEPVLAQRITALYRDGVIRAGAW